MILTICFAVSCTRKATFSKISDQAWGSSFKMIQDNVHIESGTGRDKRLYQIWSSGSAREIRSFLHPRHFFRDVFLTFSVLAANRPVTFGVHIASSYVHMNAEQMQCKVLYWWSAYWTLYEYVRISNRSYIKVQHKKRLVLRLFRSAEVEKEIKPF